MLKKDLVLRSPVTQIMGNENLDKSLFGAVLSRAGVGKTAFLVQIALTCLLSDKKVLHVSLDDHITKINIRYSDGYTKLIDSIGYVDPQKAVRLWEDINQSKVGISYNELTFDSEKINDYLKSFKKGELELPSIMIIDGLNFDSDVSAILDQLEIISKAYDLAIWFSMKIHREEALCEDGFPVQLENYKDRFKKAIFLKPVEDKIEAVMLKNGDKTDTKILLDPATLMACR